MSTTPLHTILYVHSSDEMYGADLILLQLIEGLDEATFRPIVVLPTDVPYDGLLTKALIERGVSTIHMKTAILRRKYFTFSGLFLYLFRFLLTVINLVVLIRREKVTLVHSNTLGVIPGVFAAWLTRRPHVWHVHEIIESPRPLWKLTAWLVARFSTIAVAVSDATATHLIAGNLNNADKTIVIHNGINTDPFEAQAASAARIRSEWGIGDDQVLVGMVGRISHWKGQSHFLRAAQTVASHCSHARFAFVGGVFPGNEYLLDELKQLIKQLALEELVIVSDFRRDIPAVLHAYDIFVLPSTSPDPLPTVVLEAMASARPVVANAHGGSVEMVEHGVTGWHVSPDSINEMSEAIIKLVSNPADRERMGLNGCERLHTLFSSAAFIQKWTDTYRTMIESCGQKAS